MNSNQQIVSQEISDVSLTAKSLINSVVALIESTKTHVARYTNSALVMLYWNVGALINQEMLNNKRAEYGEQTIVQVAKELTILYGSGFDRANISRMIKFSRLYPEQQICVTLSQQLSWSHIIKLMTIEDSLKRDFYTEMCRLERWSVRVFKDKMDGMLYERTALTKHPELVISSELRKLKDGDHNTPDLYLQDPYILSFLKSKNISSERDLEQAILDELQLFIQELGNDFCFVARQKRMSTADNDRYLDLLFFHRGMVRLIAIELKMTSFQPEHAGQMEWYLKWLDKHERKANEAKPLGIIICAGKDQEDIELLELDKSGIHVAQYLTELPPKEILESKLHSVIKIARENYEKNLLNQNASH